jgi:RHH-type proline utilization regulon transcriptional repressor/proline dehydrogenase/delta 1-pyrroline-5-carboxylate dehydrogenase
MGGNNAIIIDADADIDAAVGPIVQSAFGYMGQKSSAASRLIVLEENYDRFLARFKSAVETLLPGPAEDPRADVGAVIDPSVQQGILDFVKRAKAEGTILTQCSAAAAGGYFVAPTVFADIAPDSPLALEEIVGPVVCIFKAKDFDAAVRMANNSPYALAGGIFSRSPANIQRACREFLVGSLYINRAITGAMMKRHPFGGFRMSGVGAKAMGQDYLPQFMCARTIVENTFRSGFAPMEKESS